MADPQNDKVLSADQRVATIAHLNDALRQSIHSPGVNKVVMTAGVADLIGDTSLFRGFQRRAELLRTVRDYDALAMSMPAFAQGIPVYDSSTFLQTLSTVKNTLSMIEQGKQQISQATVGILDQVRREHGDDPSDWLPVFHDRRRATTRRKG